ncbi:zinc finger protein 518A isoform X2 [Anoplopoma fimbria]|uniref:zinc finger protein 518A isoform X2 n=1 Tax=Anoplopoma fimbria TaxID=229290 RepID=UPI0023EBF8CE|nr:zinc finger protein 518A isoform X2 [Anoplopoma fimbria]
MDSMDICAATSRGDNKRRVNKRNRDWHKRLHLRNTAVQPSTMQRADKHGPKKIAEEWEQSAVWPSSGKPPKEAKHGTNDSGNTLRFACSQCSDNLEYVPKDLVRHFEENHKGSPPVFSCRTCTFSTHELSYLRVHLLSHEDTFSSCSVCHDDVQRTWPEFSAHLNAHHCRNGKYSCKMCPKFSTCDVEVFLEHTYGHNLSLEGAQDPSPHTKGRNKFGPKATTQTLRCQHCGYEASQKWLIAKHVKAVHVCQNGNQRRRKRKKEEEVRSLAMKPNDPIPKVKPRLTRSAVREMCWLTQDCLSLPGKEFLDKYCHLSDPQTTLEETQQFLMKSVAGETGDQKWTKALKTVLSNVPQDMNVHPKSENGVVSNPSDLTVLTVKNKITMAQNGAMYGKRLKVMADREAVTLESATDCPRRFVGQNGCQLSDSSDHMPCLQTETKPNNDVSLPAQSELSDCTRMQENRENQELKSDQETEEHGKKPEEPAHEDGIEISSELKLTNESEGQTSVHKVAPKNKRRRRKRRARSKRVGKRSSGLALKIVLKKNPVKEKQWVSQSSLAPLGGGPLGDCPRLPSPHTTMEETHQTRQNGPLFEVHQKEWTKASKADLDDPSDAITSRPQTKPGEELTPSCAARPMGSNNKDGNTAVALKGLPPTHRETPEDAVKSPQCSGAEVDESCSALKTGRSHSTAAAGTEVDTWAEDAWLQTPGSGTDQRVSDGEMSSAADGVTPRSSSTKSSPVSISIITAQEHGEQSVQGAVDGGVPADSCPDLLTNSQQEPSPAYNHQWQPLPKHLERTLKLVAINPSQPVKRPMGDQPVVVLNHPDANIPEVARIMEVINRYRGEVQKVVLSRRTANALSAMYGEAPEESDPVDAPVDPERILRGALIALFRRGSC